MTWLPLCTLFLIIAFPGHAASINSELQQCYNFRVGNNSATSFQSFLEETPPRLTIHRVWDSSQTATLQVTIITAATLSRLEALEEQCRSWPGPLVAAVYLPLTSAGSAATTTTQLETAGTAHQDDPGHQQLQAATEAMQALFDQNEVAEAQARGGCQLQLLLLTELVLDTSVAALLPINALRNAALVAARTPLVALVDVDLLISEGLAETVRDPTSFQKLLKGCREHKVWILPAFETPKKADMLRGQHLVANAIKGSKQELQEKVTAGLLLPFASAYYPRGHNCTRFQNWFSTQSPYGVDYTVNCEPWFIIDRLSCPPYDARFRGYGWNKVQQVALVNATGFSFHVHPSAFLLHRPHPRSEAQGLYNAAHQKGAAGAASQTARKDSASAQHGPAVSKQFHRKVAAMRHTALRDMLRGTYKVVLDPGSEDCRAQLSWWKPGH